MIKVTQLTKTYETTSKRSFTAINNISLEINAGEMLAITGVSGSGKSTLLHILACLDKAYEGSVSIDNMEISKQSDRKLAYIRNNDSSIVMQDFMLIDDYSVFENVMFPLMLQKLSKKERKNRVCEALNQVGMLANIKQGADTLSGGEKQRVAIARAIVTKPKYIFADEPTGSLDKKNTDGIMQILETLNQSGITIVVVSHEQSVANHCKRKIELLDGKILS
ncbi:MAG: ABC transporter ATP-binding protein [Oscillospiraceae bacterium]|jgi:putative ABC transport system ATP-binding protein|nr:ABC transporter ATP-binding protein [Oscillospiraceae bacterium]